MSLCDHLESNHTWESMLKQLIQFAIEYGVLQKRASVNYIYIYYKSHLVLLMKSYVGPVLITSELTCFL